MASKKHTYIQWINGIYCSEFRKYSKAVGGRIQFVWLFSIASALLCCCLPALIL